MYVPLYPEAKILKGESFVVGPNTTASFIQGAQKLSMPEGATFQKTKCLFKNFSSVLECECKALLCRPECREYLVALICATSDLRCSQCTTTQPRIYSPIQSGSFFLTLNHDAKIKEHLLRDKLPQNRRAPSYDVEGITQSTGYVTLTMTDVLYMVKRFTWSNIWSKRMVLATYCKSMNMDTFLKPYDRMNRLSSKRIYWTTKSDIHVMHTQTRARLTLLHVVWSCHDTVQWCPCMA